MEKLNSGAKKLGLQLNPAQLEQFHVYYQELTDWNQRVNLTTITSYEEVQVKHFLDSLTVTLAFRPLLTDGNFIDVGAGAGIPGVPLKIALPEIRLVLVEATAKKAVFLRHLKDKLELDNVEIVVGRAEEIGHLPRYREKFDVVLSRAVAPLPALAELTLPFCAVGGSVIAQKKGDIIRELRRADKSIRILGGNLREIKHIGLEEFADERCLVIVDKISPTPERYPRRSGIPAKRPLV